MSAHPVAKKHVMRKAMLTIHNMEQYPFLDALWFDIEDVMLQTPNMYPPEYLLAKWTPWK